MSNYVRFRPPESAQASDFEARVQHEMGRIQAAQEAVARLKKIGEDPFEDGCMVVFDHDYEDGRGLYSYAAMRAVGSWYLTGAHSRPYSWVELNEFVGDAELYEVKTLELVR